MQEPDGCTPLDKAESNTATHRVTEAIRRYFHCPACGPHELPNLNEGRGAALLRPHRASPHIHAFVPSGPQHCLQARLQAMLSEDNAEKIIVPVCAKK